MAHGEWVGNLGYAAFATESTPGTAATPTAFTLLSEETMTTNYNLEDQDPVFGYPAATYQVLAGQRDHKGDITIVGEPNTATHLVDSLLKRGSSTGTGPYTWPFTLDGNTAPKSKTLDISTGNVVKRFVGVQTSKLTFTESKNQIMLKGSMSALGSFQGGLIASITGAGPYTVAFDTTYDTNPTGKLVVGDLIRFYHQATGATVDATVATIVDAKTITTSTNPTPAVAGDMVCLRPQTQSFTLLTPFLWSNTQFCFGSSASAALSAAQTRLEQGSTWEIDYAFNSDNGEPRSGSADPASLIRTVASANLNIKKFFDTPDDIMLFNNTTKSACVVRMYAGSTNQYELRVTLNHLVTDDPLPKVKSKAVNYSDIKYHTQYSQTDSQMFDIKVINGLSAIA